MIALPKVVTQLLIDGCRKDDALSKAFFTCSEEWDKGILSEASSNDVRSKCGAVCVVALIDESADNQEQEGCVVASVGDCGCAASNSDGSFSLLGAPHRTSNPLEVKRVENQGGEIIVKKGVPRVAGCLVPTRAFGNTYVRKVDGSGKLADFLQPEPELHWGKPAMVARLGQNLLILGSDGLFDFMPMAKISMIVTSGFEKGLSASTIAQTLGNKCSNSDDDVSIIVVAWEC